MADNLKLLSNAVTVFCHFFVVGIQNCRRTAGSTRSDPSGSLGGSAELESSIFGGNSEEVTPVPVPITEVKLLSADGTARATWWESRSPPNSFL